MRRGKNRGGTGREVTEVHKDRNEASWPKGGTAEEGRRGWEGRQWSVFFSAAPCSNAQQIPEAAAPTSAGLCERDFGSFLKESDSGDEV